MTAVQNILSHSVYYWRIYDAGLSKQITFVFVINLSTSSVQNY